MDSWPWQVQGHLQVAQCLEPRGTPQPPGRAQSGSTYGFRALPWVVVCVCGCARPVLSAPAPHPHSHRQQRKLLLYGPHRCSGSTFSPRDTYF